MSRDSLRSSAIALSMAAFISVPAMAAGDYTLPVPSNEPASQPAHPPSVAPAQNGQSAAAPSLNEPAPTPNWAESGPQGSTAAHGPAIRQASRHHTRRYVSRNWRRTYSGNPVTTAATGVAGGVADLGSVAAYPFYCFPNYGSCSVRVPYRF